MAIASLAKPHLSALGQSGVASPDYAVEIITVRCENVARVVISIAHVKKKE